MANETEKNQQNPGQRQQNDAANVNDPNRKDPSQSGDTSDRKDREGSEEVEKRRAS